jgi:hypothetical protein
MYITEIFANKKKMEFQPLFQLPLLAGGGGQQVEHPWAISLQASYSSVNHADKVLNDHHPDSVNTNTKLILPMEKEKLQANVIPSY